MNQTINSENFKRSIDVALANIPNCQQSIKTIQGILANMPKENLVYAHSKGYIAFRETFGKKQESIRRTSERAYILARKRYLKLLLEILELSDINSEKYMHLSRFAAGEKKETLIKEMHQLIEIYEQANLDIARIVMTSKQYKWYTSKFKSKRIESELKTNAGISTRSKSERSIGNTLEKWAAFYHFEEQLQINVRFLVNSLRQYLQKQNFAFRSLSYESRGTTYWNVPEELQWMNAVGSVWRTYNSRTGMITIYPDFSFLFASAKKLCWEHEGLMDDFMYRCNSTERISIIRLQSILEDSKYTNSSKNSEGPASPILIPNVITSFEQEIRKDSAIEQIVLTQIVPFLWF